MRGEIRDVVKSRDNVLLGNYPQRFGNKKGEKRNALGNCNMRGMANACELI
jgi:hypothetical protein